MGMSKETTMQIKELSSLLPVITIVAVFLMTPSIVEDRSSVSEIYITLLVFFLITAGVGILFVLLERCKKLASCPYCELKGDDGGRS